MKIHPFGVDDPLAALESFPQAQYLRCYLKDIDAAHVVEESRYFDRDYLEEHAAYYGSVAAQYGSLCRRLHFFDSSFSADTLERALANETAATDALQQGYLGFVVLRPLPHAPLGRTVIKWYPDEPERYSGNPRIVTPSRSYAVHLAGVRLSVFGLAWQQQDGAVALCATTALWSMLHSSAFDDHHAVPTTSDVTRFAYRSLREGAHVFPATEGLENWQIAEAIARANLTPVLIDSGPTSGFSQEQFATTCAAMVRSGFPVLLSGVLEESGMGHMTCLTGFRETGPAPGSSHQDSSISVFYVHDDNLGPNVRQELSLDGNQRVLLTPKAPPHRYPGARLNDPTETYSSFRPEQMIIGVHEGLHMLPTQLVEIGRVLAEMISGQLTDTTLSSTVRFMKLAEYQREMLPRSVGRQSDSLAGLRRDIAEKLPPMSLHIGVVRIGVGATLVADVLIDASELSRLELPDSSLWWRAFGTVLFAAAYRDVIDELAEEISFGEILSGSLRDSSQ